MTTRGLLRATRALLIIGAILGTLAWPTGSPAAIRTVTDCGDTGAAGQLRTLINAAASGDTIVVPACTITVTAPLNVTLPDLTILGSGAGATFLDGGGVFQVLNLSTTMTVSGLTVRNGRAASGAGIFNGGTLTLVDSHVTNNHAQAAGSGGGITSLGRLALINSAVSGNTAPSGNGGGIFSDGFWTTITNSTISGNSAVGGNGGGIDHSAGLLTVISSTIANNAAGAGFGGGLFLGASGALRNTIVAGNTAAFGANCFNPASSGGHNLESANTCGLNPALGDLPGTNPLLGPLQFNGGPTPTHALLAGSPAIDAGDAVGCPDRDQRGVRRPLDGTGGGLARCDIGAVEARGPLLVSTGTGPTGGPHVRLFRVDPAGTPTALGGGFFAYDAGFTGGVQATLVVVGSELFVVTGVGSGGGPHIKLFKVTDLGSGTVTQVGPGFMAYDTGFTGGARVAATTDDVGHLLIVTGTGFGGGAHVKVFQVTNLATGDVQSVGGGFFAYDPGFTGGVNVGAR